YPRLIVMLEARHPTRDIGPFGKAGPPPFVVFRKSVKLREVISQYLGAEFSSLRQWPLLFKQNARSSESPDFSRNSCFFFRRNRKNTFFITVLQIVKQRVLICPTLEVTLDIEFGVEPIRRIASLLVTVKNEMLKRIYPGRRNIFVDFEVVSRIKFRNRTKRTETILQIMSQRTFVRWDVVLLTIPSRLKIRTWATALALADLGIM